MMIVKVVEHDPQWKNAFLAEAERIQYILGSELINAFHIGSTAVEGLKAKPIIDIMLLVESIPRLDEYSSRFESLGYEIMGEFGIPGRCYFRKGGKNRTHQIHAFQFDNIQNIERHLAVRDYLRSHKSVCVEYALLKTQLASKFPEDIEGYSDGKETFVAAIEKEAIKWRYRTRS